MRFQALENPYTKVPPRVSPRRYQVVRGIIVGLLPPGLLLSMIGAALLFTTIARQVTAQERLNFFEQQQIDLVVLVVMLVFALLLFGITTLQTVQHIRIWRERGLTRGATSALVTLTGTAFLVVLPILLAILLPQHPAS